MTLSLAAYLIIVGGLFFTIWKRPAVAIAGVLCMFGLEQWGQATTPFFAQHQSATNLVVGILVLLAFCVRISQKGAAAFSGYPAVGVLILVLYLYAFASSQWAPRPDLGHDLWLNRIPYLALMLLAAPVLVTRLKDLRTVNRSFVLAGGLLSALLLFFVEWESRLIILENGPGNPLAVASMAGMVALVATLTDPLHQSRVWQPLRWAIVVMAMGLIVRSGSRGQLLGVLLVILICWPLNRGLWNVKQLASLAGLASLLGLAILWAVQEFWTRPEYQYHATRWTGDSAHEDVQGRLDNALLLLSLAFDSTETMCFGLGNSAAYDPRILGIYPHFVPLEILAEEGIFGFILYVAIIVLASRNIVRYLRLLPTNSDDRRLLTGLIGLSLFSFILSLKQGSLLGNLDPFMFTIILARCGSCHALGQDMTLASSPGVLDESHDEFVSVHHRQYTGIAYPK